MLTNFICAVKVSSLHELIFGNGAAYVNREVEQSRHPLHRDSGVIFGHYSDVLEERGENVINIQICSRISAPIIYAPLSSHINT